MPERELTYGEDAVGISFNPSQNTEVHEMKVLYAAIIDALHEQSLNASSPKQSHLYEVAEDQALTAQMAAVKAITKGLK